MTYKFREDLLKRKPIRGKAEIFDDKGNLIKVIDNLILLSTRLAILYNLFKDNKILITAQDKGYLPISSDQTKKSYQPTICGFMFGCNGVNKSNPSIIRVPSPIDNYKNEIALDHNSTQFIPVPMISVADSGGALLNTAGSYQNISEFINSPVISETVISDNIGDSSIVKYFSPDDLGDPSNYYCKAINTSNSELKINTENYEIEYIIKFSIGSYDLIGKSFNEIGLVLANCEISDTGLITDIDTTTVCLASRLTFDEISLSKKLLSSFNIKYHIYI